jgi:Transmembrane adaptor Erv26
VYFTHCLLSLLSSGDNLWSTAMDWMPQFEHLDALKQLFPDRYCIILQLLTRLWIIKSAVLELTHFLISSHLIYHCNLLSSPFHPLLFFTLLLSFLTFLIVSSSIFPRFLQWSLCSSKNTVASGDDRYTDSDDKDDAKNAFVQILPYRSVGRRHCYTAAPSPCLHLLLS